MTAPVLYSPTAQARTNYPEAFVLRRFSQRVHSYNSSRDALANHGATHLEGKELCSLLHRAEQGNLSSQAADGYRRFIDNNHSLWLRAVMLWEGTSLYLGIGEMAENVVYSPASNQHVWTERPARGALFDLPESAKRKQITLKRSMFDAYGRAMEPPNNAELPTFEILPEPTFTLTELCAENPTFSTELFGEPFSRLPAALAVATLTLPTRAGVPMPVAYQPLHGKLGGALYTSSIVGVRR